MRSCRNFVLSLELPEIPTQVSSVGHRYFFKLPGWFSSAARADTRWCKSIQLHCLYPSLVTFPHLPVACFLPICKVLVKVFGLCFIRIFLTKWFFFQVLFLCSDLDLQGKCWLSRVHFIHDLLTAAYVSTVNLVPPEKPLLLLNGYFFVWQQIVIPSSYLCFPSSLASVFSPSCYLQLN